MKKLKRETEEMRKALDEAKLEIKRLNAKIN